MQGNKPSLISTSCALVITPQRANPKQKTFLQLKGPPPIASKHIAVVRGVLLIRINFLFASLCKILLSNPVIVKKYCSTFLNALILSNS